MVNELITKRNNFNLESPSTSEKQFSKFKSKSKSKSKSKDQVQRENYKERQPELQTADFSELLKSASILHIPVPQSQQSNNKIYKHRTDGSSFGGNLSWKFFDQISILDYQLRDEVCAPIIMNSSGSATTSPGTVPANIHYNPKSSVTLSPNTTTNSNNNNNPQYQHHSQLLHLNDIHLKNPSASLIATTPTQTPIQNNNFSSESNVNLRNDPMINTNTIGMNNQHRQTIANFPSTNSTSPGTITATVPTNSRIQLQSGRHCGNESPNSKDAPTHHPTHNQQYGIGFHLGLCGWRKKCLYTLILVLMLLIIVNLVLTLWILKVMEFSSEGMGQLKIVPGGVQLSGQALIMDLLRASTIRSKHGQPIILESSRNFSINTRDSEGILENHLFLGHDKLECLATGFRINDTSGRNLFSVNRDEVSIGAHSLRIDGEGGAIFRESIQTPHVRAEAGRELRLESPTRQLEMTAAKDITIQSRAGGLEMTAVDDVKLSAIDGSIRLESSKIFLPNLKAAQLLSSGTVQNSRADHSHRVYQLCACSNGKLFLAAPHSICAGDDNSVCR